jgi:hypothetical protein
MDQHNQTSADINEGTDTSGQTQSQETQATNRVYTQQEVDNMMAGLKGSLQRKLLKPYEELGDIDELRQLKQQAEQVRQQEAMKRGEFEKILAEMAEKKDAEIRRRDAVIQEYKIDTPLIATAAEMRSVNPDQVRALLKSRVRLNSEGEVEVVDDTGSVRYSDAGRPMAVKELVQEFLTTNPHFVQPAPTTTNSRSSISAPVDRLDITKLDMKNPEHRKVYAQYRKDRGIA